MLILYPSFRRLATTFSLHLSAACGGTSPLGEAVGEAPLEGETGEAPPAAEKASRFRGSGAIGGPARDRESLCRDGVGAAKGGGEVAHCMKSYDSFSPVAHRMGWG